ncbi:MAG: hypothetical protein RL172_2127 [Bacteroidota bacterium]|jgi:hypothetical protein
MHKRLDLTHLGGMPLSQADLKHLLDSYSEAFAGLSAMCGAGVIISGMEEAAGFVQAGWLAINNELIPFAAGNIGTGEFAISETSVSRTFNNGNSNIVRYTKEAAFAVGGTYNFSDLVRIGSLKADMPKSGDMKIINCDAAYIAANFDGSGLGTNKRIGWAICNGNNGTIDMGGQMPLGYKPVDHLMGTSGGSATHTLTVDEMPTHRHQVSTTGNQTGVDPGRALQRSSTNGDAYSNGSGSQEYLQNTGGGQPHNNMPPYKVVLFIQKL